LVATFRKINFGCRQRFGLAQTFANNTLKLSFAILLVYFIQSKVYARWIIGGALLNHPLHFLDKLFLVLSIACLSRSLRDPIFFSL